jgi:hypothetical protein
MTNEVETRLNALLREAAKSGNAEAKRAWRILNGYPETPLPSLPRLVLERS